MAANTRQEMAALLQVLLAIAKFARLRGCIGGLFFSKKKLLKGIKGLKTIRSGDLKPKKQTFATKKHFDAVIARNKLTAKGSSPMPIGRCFASICCSGSLPHILIKIRIFSAPPFPLRKNHCALTICGFAAVFAAPVLAGLWHLRCIAGKGQCYSSTKNQLSEVLYLAVAFC